MCVCGRHKSRLGRVVSIRAFNLNKEGMYGFQWFIITNEHFNVAATREVESGTGDKMTV